MSKLEMIPKLSMKEFEKCEFSSQAKLTKISHKSVLKESKPLDLIHSHLCKIDGIITSGSNKRYFITFIDACSAFICLLKNKSDPLNAFK